jgi:prepilin-type N-terminal cleavage/methylation domain-containing protein
MRAVKKRMPRNRESGFTLVELAISITIISLFVAAAIPLYTMYLKQKAITTTRENQADVYYALLDYKSKLAKYPCPASLSKPISDPLYGRSETCPSALAPGACLDGVCVEQGPVQITTLPGPTLTTTRVVRGAVPYKVLGLTEKQAYDGYGRRLVYAVTERLTDQDQFDENHGGIQLVNAANASLTDPTPGAGGTHFVIVSGGERGDGFYNHDGNMVGTCDTTRLEGENCDQTPLAVYRISSVSDAGNNQDFDDFVVYNAVREPVLWNYQDASPLDVGDRARQNVGVGMEPAPGMKLSVAGNVRVQNPGTMDSNTYCEQGANNCFLPELLAAGEECATMDPARPYMVGFNRGHINCVADATIGCTPPEVLTGFDSAGIPICDVVVIPPRDCAPQPVPICSSTYTLPASAHGSTHNAVFNSRSERYSCNDGVWLGPSNISGTCVCTPRTVNVTTRTAADCAGMGMVGTQVTQYVTTCSPYAVTATIIQDCTPPIPCPASSRTICSGTGVDQVLPLPASPSGTVISSPTVGHSRRESFRCFNGTWSANGTSGFCLPPANCPNRTVNICGTPANLTTAAHNAIQTVTGGHNRAEQYRCNNGTWSMTGSNGSCVAPANCTATTRSLCSTTVPLGAGLHGDVQTPSGGFGSQFTCVSGSWNKSRTETCPVLRECKWLGPGSGPEIGSRGARPEEDTDCTGSEGVSGYCWKVQGGRLREVSCTCVCKVL